MYAGIYKHKSANKVTPKAAIYVYSVSVVCLFSLRKSAKG